MRASTSSNPERRWVAVAALASLLAGCGTRVPLTVPAPRLPPTTAPAPMPIPAAPAGLPPPPGAEPAYTVPVPPQPAASATVTPLPGNGVESPALAARFPDPAVAFQTPAFEPGRTGYTTNAELRQWLRGLVRVSEGTGDPTTVRLVQAGSSQAGVPLEALHFTRAPALALGALPATAAGSRTGRPVVLLVGQQHGDEPAGAEALLTIADRLANGPLGAVLDRLDVVILPRANPDGAASDRRTTANGIDANRDHLLLRTPEAQAQALLVREFKPVVVVDSHEFAALGRYVEKFGAAQRFDALLQYAMVANLPPFVSKASEEWFRQPMVQALKAEGLAHEWYYTTSTDLADKKVSMGGVQPDTGRNVNGLRNAVSFLVETRGGGLGRAHLARRVQTHVVAVTSVLESAAARAPDLLRLRRFVDADVAAAACQGQTVVEAEQTPSEFDLQMLDPTTGADRVVPVAWDSALELTVTKRRARPCGYWLGADQADAVLRLRSLGVVVHRLDEDGEFKAEVYAETSRTSAARRDVRGTVADGSTALKVGIELVPSLIDVRAGGYYVGLDQPLANLVIAALEPDTQSSFVAHRILTDVTSEARVVARPEARMSPLP